MQNNLINILLNPESMTMNCNGVAGAYCQGCPNRSTCYALQSNMDDLIDDINNGKARLKPYVRNDHRVAAMG